MWRARPLYSDSSGQPDYGDKRAEIGGSDPGAMPGGSTRTSLFGDHGAEIGSTDVEGCCFCSGGPVTGQTALLQTTTTLRNSPSLRKQCGVFRT